MRVTGKKVVKALVPYGALVAYRRVKPRASTIKNSYTQRRESDKRLKHLLTSARPLNKKKNPKVVISLTSYGERLNRIAPFAVASLFNQTTLPDRIVLWLAHGETPPKSLKQMTKLGLEIKYCKDLRSYKKLIPALSEYSKSTIVTVDDDVVYPRDWLSKTLTLHKKEPKTIFAHRARKIIINKDKSLASYWEWPLLEENIKNTHLILPTGVGGVLYPPNSFLDEVFNEELFMSLAPYGDDLWFWAMSELNGTKRAVVDEGYYNITDYEMDPEGLWNTLNSHQTGGNDAQITSILEHFPILRSKIGIPMSGIKMTGLRFDPARMKSFEEQILFAKHQFAYDFAAQQAKDGKALSILDYGCGDGYGADFLAKMFPKSHVFATDIDEEALNDARKKYRRKNLHFVEMNKLETYDLIASFQVIEHVENVEEYLRFLRGLLKKEGKIIISTPDRRYRLNDDQEPWNPYHLREYTKASFSDDINQVFSSAKIFQLSGEKNMLRIEYRRVTGMRNDTTIYGGKEPKEKPGHVYRSTDFFLTENDTEDSLDLFALIKNDFLGSEDYWESRYALGGNSGAGSYDNLAEFKAKVINKFVKKNKIRTVIEFGTGDGNQLILAKYPHYIGFDVSKTAVELCKKIFKGDSTKEFYTLDKFKNQKADLTMSLDVLYHLIEQDVFDRHIQALFDAATNFVIIYAFDDDKFHTAEHVQSRNFTKYINDNFKEWELIKHIPNKYPHKDEDPNHTSRADFYIYKRK